MAGVLIFAILAGRALGLPMTEGKAAKQTNEDLCYGIGKCMPSYQPRSQDSQICQLYEESVVCLRRATAACRQVDFPPEILALSELKLVDQEDYLNTYCSSEVSESQDALPRSSADTGTLHRKSPGPQAVEVAEDYEKLCYNVGTCTPPNELAGDDSQACRVYGETLTCMQKAMDACRRINFPPDIVAISELKIKELRHALQVSCWEREASQTQTGSPPRLTSPGAKTGASSSGEKWDMVADEDSAISAGVLVHFSPLFVIVLTMASVTYLWDFVL